ncbi:MAG: hypothetical protein DRR00_25210 [Candidatus Parabeggiatoa sp. nov. 3]|nr:MAG: hypothetical protein DRR00_25210 [Gammaproteobacteria bacterium]RKZ59537.1 MAG: hypothetical protein DRQ99_23575 [Gammaproteobacteria bacterium]
MAFRHYKNIAQVQKEYEVQYQEFNFIRVNEVKVSKLFLREFEFNLKNLDVFSSEGARCELVILPLLREAYKNYVNQFVLWVQKSIRYDKVLNGTPDYIISKRSKLGKTVLEYPLLMVAEAKKNDFDQGWGQCLAELVAAQKLNNDSDLPVYGIVTDGKYWEFGKLEQAIFTKNKDSFPVNHVETILGILDFLFSLAKSNY